MIGLMLVVGEQARAARQQPISRPAFAAITAALLSTTARVLYQKRFGGGADLTAAAAIQSLAAGALVAPLPVAEALVIDLSVPALARLLLALSPGAMLLLALVRQHAVSRVASLLYLVPTATALEAYLLFGERLGPQALIDTVAVPAASSSSSGSPGRRPMTQAGVRAAQYHRSPRGGAER